MQNPIDSTFPVTRDGHEFTIVTVHPHTDPHLFGMVTLRGEGGEVIVAASEVHRRLYVIRLDGRGHQGNLLRRGASVATFTWNEASEWLRRLRKNARNEGITFSVRVAQ